MPISNSDLQHLQELLNSNDRGAFYQEVARLYSVNGSSYEAFRAVLYEAKVSTYSVAL